MNVQFSLAYHRAGSLPEGEPEVFAGDDVAEVLAAVCDNILDDLTVSEAYNDDEAGANAVHADAVRQLVHDPRRFAQARSGFVIADATTGGHYRWSVEPVTLPQGAARRSAA